MSIVIDEDDDLMIVDNNIQTVYTDDKKANYQKNFFEISSLKFPSFRAKKLPGRKILKVFSFYNIWKLVEVIERDLNDRVDLFADAYADIYKHYDNAVKKLLDDKEELDKKIQDAFQERKEIIRGRS